MWAYTKACSNTKLETMMIKVISKDKLCERKILLFMLLNLNCNLLFIIYFFRIHISSLTQWIRERIKRSMLHKLSFNFYFVSVSFFFGVFNFSFIFPTNFHKVQHYFIVASFCWMAKSENKRKHKTFFKKSQKRTGKFNILLCSFFSIK